MVWVLFIFRDENGAIDVRPVYVLYMWQDSETERYEGKRTTQYESMKKMKLCHECISS